MHTAQALAVTPMMNNGGGRGHITHAALGRCVGTEGKGRQSSSVFALGAAVRGGEVSMTYTPEGRGGGGVFNPLG